MTRAVNVASSTNLALVTPTITGATITVASTAAPAFSAYLSSAQTITAGATTKIAFDAEFFDTNNLDTFEPVLDKFIKKLNNNEYTPREWFIKNYGKYNSGKKLMDFVKSVFKEDELNIKFDEIEYMKPGI